MPNAVTKDTRTLGSNRSQEDIFGNDGNIAKDYFYNQKNQTVELIKLNGSIELAPIVGLAEVIVDIVETGGTLKETGKRHAAYRETGAGPFGAGYSSGSCGGVKKNQADAGSRPPRRHRYR